MTKKTKSTEKASKRTAKKAVEKKSTIEKSSAQEKKSIPFKIYAPEASSAYLVGDFNNWDQCSLSMKKRDDGYWETSIELSPGEYQYKYLIDGKWENDITEEMVPNQYGTMNNIIKIPKEK